MFWAQISLVGYGPYITRNEEVFRSYIRCCMKPNIAILNMNYNHILTESCSYVLLHENFLMQNNISFMLRLRICA